MTCEIPQGSSLGPLLFLIYINDLLNCSSALAFRIHADNTNVFASACDMKTLEKTVNSELKKVKIWCDVNIYCQLTSPKQCKLHDNQIAKEKRWSSKYQY